MNNRQNKFKVRVLVFPCGSEIGLEAQRALAWSTHVDLYGASSVKDHGGYVYKNYIEGLPFVDAPDFIEKLNEIIVSNGIDFVLPAHDSVVLKLAENAQNLRCRVIGSLVDTCRVCRSKRKTYEVFKKTFFAPEVYESIDKNVRLPIFLKPDVGQGSKGVYTANSHEEADLFLRTNPLLVAMEHLPGEEYTVDCFTDRHGALRFAGARLRKRIMNGISVDTVPVTDDRLNSIAEEINRTLRFRGVWFFQAKKRANDDVVLLEIAPRIAGAMALYRNLGLNFTLLSIFDALDMDVVVKANSYPVELDRALINRFNVGIEYRHVYIDLDDTVIFNDAVNVWMVAFLYQCRNRGIKTHLLSYHDGDIVEALKKFRLDTIFDTVTSLDRSKPKTDFIKEPASIYIDDSFAERRRVSEKLGIPTFDATTIESLLDWRL